MGCVWDDCNSQILPFIDKDFMLAAMKYLLDKGYIEDLGKLHVLKGFYLPSFAFKSSNTGGHILHFYTNVNGIFVLISRMPLVSIETLELCGEYTYEIALKKR